MSNKEKTKHLEFKSQFILSSAELQELTKLRELNFKSCKQMAPLYIGILEKKRFIPSIIVRNKTKGEIIGFATMFLFDAEAVELSCFIHPKFLSKELIISLFEPFTAWLQQNIIKTLTLPKPLFLQHPWFKDFSFQYKKSEYHLVLKNMAKNPKLAPVEITVANEALLEELANLHILCFPITLDVIKLRLESTFKEPESLIIIAKKDNKIIGKLHIRFEKFTIQFTDIAVHPDFQRQGIATTLIMDAIERANAVRANRSIMLNVEADNQKAYDLYLKLGFVKTTNCDYFTLAADNWLNKIAKK